MKIERKPFESSVDDDLLAAELHDAVWVADEESETFQQDPPVRAASMPEAPAPQRPKTPLND